jgi:glycosyltransferase involved in cell wall biosynthesis
MKKKKILLMTNWSLNKTGFARFAKALLEYLHKTGKYDLVHLSGGAQENSPDLERTPWKSLGTINPQKLQEIKNQNPPHTWVDIERSMAYGAYSLDEVAKKEKPDVVLLAEDIWGINWATKFDWFHKTTSVLWTTLDSRPILPAAIESAKESKHFWSWADFATKDLHKLGLNHTRTVPGCIDTHNFFPLSESKKLEIKTRVGISKDDFIIGMVGRNQLRKGFPNIIEAYSIFKKENPEIKNTKLFFHTSFAEGWPLHKYCEQFNVNKNELLTTYICPHCGNYEIKPFTGHNLDCKFCGVKGGNGSGQMTTHPGLGITEKQLNEIYNILDFYLQVITSGGLEIPVIENLLAANAPAAMTNYSCGEDYCSDPNSGVLSLDWDKYLEGTGTDFIKAWTKPYSIAKSMKKIYNMDKKDRQELAKKGREWCLNRFSPSTIGKIVEQLADEAAFADPAIFESKPLKKNPNYIPSNNPNQTEWLTELYVNFFGRQTDNQGLQYWLEFLNKK